VTIAAQPDDPETPHVQSAVRAAINDAMDAGTYKGVGTTGPVGPAVVKATHANLDRRLKEHMTGKAKAAWQHALSEAIDRDSDGEHLIVTAGGVDRFETSTVEVKGDSATISGRAHVWVTWVIHKAEVKGPHTGHPVEWDAFSATLTRIDGKWYVDGLVLKPEGNG
jgi:hypothetical protein